MRVRLKMIISSMIEMDKKVARLVTMTSRSYQLMKFKNTKILLKH